MTPKMEAALEAAARAGGQGLHWTRAGWTEPGALDCHGPVVVSRLVHDHGYLFEAGWPGRKLGLSRRVITEKGEAYLATKKAVRP